MQMTIATSHGVKNKPSVGWKVDVTKVFLIIKDAFELSQ